MAETVEKQTYTREEVYECMKEFLEVILGKKDDMDAPEEFIRRHPWTRKYLGIGYFEGKRLFEMSREEGFTIKEWHLSPGHQKVWEERGMPEYIRFGISTASFGRVFSFNFRAVEGEENLFKSTSR